MPNVVDEFAAAWALKQLVDKATKTGVTGNLRDQVNDYYRTLYQLDGKRGHDIVVNGEKVGRYTFDEKKGEPARIERTVTAYDYDAILADDNEDFAEWLSAYIKMHIGELAERYVRETGDVLDGVMVTEDEVPEVPASVAANGKPGGFRADKVAEAFGPALGEGMGDLIAGLLGE